MGNEITTAEKDLLAGAGVYSSQAKIGAEVPFFKRYTFTGSSQADQTANLLTSDSFRRYWSKGMTDNNHHSLLTTLADKVVPKELKMGNFPDTVSGIRVASPNEIEINALINKGKLDFTTPYRRQYGINDYELSGMNAEGNSIYSIKPDARNLNKTYWDLRNTGGAQLAEDRALLSILKYRNDDPASGLTRWVSNNSADDILGLSSELQRHTTAVDTQVMPNKPAKIIYRDGWMKPEMELSRRILKTNAELIDERNAILLANAQANRTTGVNFYIDSEGQIVPLQSRQVLNTADDIAPIGSNAEPTPFVARTDPLEEKQVGRIKYTRPANAPSGVSNQTTEVYGPPKFSDILKARGQQALGLGAKGLTALSVLATPFDAVSRRNEYFADYYEKNGKEPSDLMGAGMRLRAGIEPALNAATFGAYDTPRNIQGIMNTTTGLQEAQFIKSKNRLPTEEEKLKMLEAQYEYSGFYM